jgi:hypothetical protein
LLYILREAWLWIIIFFLIMILVGPFVILYLLLLLPVQLRVGSTFLIIILWALVGGYKDWVMDKRKRKVKGFEELQH